jgi:rubredoxin
MTDTEADPKVAELRMAELRMAELRMECGICWHVYDPAMGDSVWQVSAGTSFADLPKDWRCPVCDAPQDKYMKLDHE